MKLRSIRFTLTLAISASFCFLSQATAVSPEEITGQWRGKRGDSYLVEFTGQVLTLTVLTPLGPVRYTGRHRYTSESPDSLFAELHGRPYASAKHLQDVDKAVPGWVLKELESAQNYQLRKDLSIHDDQRLLLTHVVDNVVWEEGAVPKVTRLNRGVHKENEILERIDDFEIESVTLLKGDGQFEAEGTLGLHRPFEVKVKFSRRPKTDQVWVYVRSTHEAPSDLVDLRVPITRNPPTLDEQGTNEGTYQSPRIWCGFKGKPAEVDYQVEAEAGDIVMAYLEDKEDLAAVEAPVRIRVLCPLNSHSALSSLAKAQALQPNELMAVRQMYRYWTFVIEVENEKGDRPAPSASINVILDLKEVPDGEHTSRTVSLNHLTRRSQRRSFDVYRTRPMLWDTEDARLPSIVHEVLPLVNLTHTEATLSHENAQVRVDVFPRMVMQMAARARAGLEFARDRLAEEVPRLDDLETFYRNADAVFPASHQFVMTESASQSRQALQAKIQVIENALALMADAASSRNEFREALQITIAQEFARLLVQDPAAFGDRSSTKAPFSGPNRDMTGQEKAALNRALTRAETVQQAIVDAELAKFALEELRRLEVAAIIAFEISPLGALHTLVTGKNITGQKVSGLDRLLAGADLLLCSADILQAFRAAGAVSDAGRATAALEGATDARRAAIAGHQTVAARASSEAIEKANDLARAREQAARGVESAGRAAGNTLDKARVERVATELGVDVISDQAKTRLILAETKGLNTQQAILWEALTHGVEPATVFEKLGLSEPEARRVFQDLLQREGIPVDKHPRILDDIFSGRAARNTAEARVRHAGKFEEFEKARKLREQAERRKRVERAFAEHQDDVPTRTVPVEDAKTTQRLPADDTTPTQRLPADDATPAQKLPVEDDVSKRAFKAEEDAPVPSPLAEDNVPTRDLPAAGPDSGPGAGPDGTQILPDGRIDPDLTDAVRPPGPGAGPDGTQILPDGRVDPGLAEALPPPLRLPSGKVLDMNRLRQAHEELGVPFFRVNGDLARKAGHSTEEAILFQGLTKGGDPELVRKLAGVSEAEGRKIMRRLLSQELDIPVLPDNVVDNFFSGRVHERVKRSPENNARVAAERKARLRQRNEQLRAEHENLISTRVDATKTNPAVPLPETVRQPHLPVPLSETRANPALGPPAPTELDRAALPFAERQTDLARRTQQLPADFFRQVQDARANPIFEGPTGTERFRPAFEGPTGTERLRPAFEGPTGTERLQPLPRPPKPRQP